VEGRKREAGRLAASPHFPDYGRSAGEATRPRPPTIVNSSLLTPNSVQFQDIGNRKYQDIGKGMCQHIGETSW